MSQGITDWGKKPPREYLHRFGELMIDTHDPATERTVEMALLAEDGPIETVLWVILEEYDDHAVFIQGDQPEKVEVQKLHSWHPDEEQMLQLTAYFQQTYNSCREVEAVLIEIPDTYNPQLGRRPRVNVAAFYDPTVNRIHVETMIRPLQHQERILEDVNKLVPADDLTDFLHQIDRKLTEEIIAEHDWRLLTGDVRNQLEADPDFRQETTKPIPDKTHPEYAGENAELWQKPASAVDSIPGSQGFLQVWLPVNEPETAIITATPDEYDKPTIIGDIHERFETASRVTQ